MGSNGWGIEAKSAECWVVCASCNCIFPQWTAGEKLSEAAQLNAAVRSAQSIRAHTAIRLGLG